MGLPSGNFSPSSAPDGEEAAGIIAHDHAIAVAAKIEHQLLERAIVQNVIADNAVLESAVDNSVRGAVNARASVVAAGLNAVADAGHSLRAIHQDLRRFVAIGRGQLAAALDEVAGDG